MMRYSIDTEYPIVSWPIGDGWGLDESSYSIYSRDAINISQNSLIQLSFHFNSFLAVMSHRSNEIDCSTDLKEWKRFIASKHWAIDRPRFRLLSGGNTNWRTSRRGQRYVGIGMWYIRRGNHISTLGRNKSRWRASTTELKAANVLSLNIYPMTTAARSNQGENPLQFVWAIWEHQKTSKVGL